MRFLFGSGKYLPTLFRLVDICIFPTKRDFYFWRKQCGYFAKRENRNVLFLISFSFKNTVLTYFRSFNNYYS